ncbi:hypothetical protein RhiJN_08229 [Ceratobasidium sp. AG-Ba]|nr:hypothetical protein RhiJN_08229 [Ceratobasidium sp. AG-Ba]QRW09013.1 hypothetical protein RhiLY_08012 [Ceratobasidium sp. AG-Ba]
MPNRHKTSYEFSLTPVNKNNIPPLNVLLSSANALLASTVHWPPGKTYHDGLVQTFSQKLSSGPSWHGRLSYHPIEHGTFHEFWEVVGVRHCASQEEYVPELVSATHLEPYLEGEYQGWTFHYSYSPPVSPRTFTILLATSLDDNPPRQGWVISIPFDVGENEGLKALEEKGVRGRFTTVERLMEVDDKVEWMAVTMNQIGGSIPDFISERKMPKQFSEAGIHSYADILMLIIPPSPQKRVPQVLEYMAAKREGQTGRKPKLVSRSSSLSIIKKARRKSVNALSSSAPTTPAASTSSAINTEAADGPSSTPNA